MKTYLECWIGVAKVLFSQALAGEPELDESEPAPLPEGSFGFAATLTGDVAGRFEVLLDAAILESPLLGEGVDQKAGWGELLREVSDAAAGELLATTGRRCHAERFDETSGGFEASRAFRLHSCDRSFAVSVCDETREPQPSAGRQAAASAEEQPANISPGIELLLDVELEVSLRFGCRELPLGEILDLGPGDVVQLDRRVADPVDLIVGDKIVARGEVVLVNGNFGLRVTEVAAPRKRLESIRCLF